MLRTPRLYMLFFAPLFSGCTALGAVSTISQVANVAMELSGVNKPKEDSLPDTQRPPRKIAIKVHADENLNAGKSLSPLALVVKVYKLRQSDAFQQAPYESFMDARKEKELLGHDLLEVKEVTLVPGQRFEIIEKVSKEAGYVGVVALFRQPSPHRWKAAFAAESAEKSGVTVGMHGCALSVGSGTPVFNAAQLSARLSTLPCQ